MTENRSRQTGYFPLFISLEGKPVLVVGAGTVAARRAGVLADFGAVVTVVAPEGCSRMQQLEQEGKLIWHHRVFRPEDLDGAFLAGHPRNVPVARFLVVVAATDDPAVNDRVAAGCRRRQIPVCHAGDKNQSDFYFPGIVRDGSLVVGVTASGEDHHLARTVTEKIRKLLGK